MKRSLVPKSVQTGVQSRHKRELSDADTNQICGEVCYSEQSGCGQIMFKYNTDYRVLINMIHLSVIQVAYEESDNGDFFASCLRRDSVLHEAGMASVRCCGGGCRKSSCNMVHMASRSTFSCPPGTIINAIGKAPFTGKSGL